MGIIDHGTSGQTLAAPSLAAWAASVAAVLDNSDTPISARLAAIETGGGGTGGGGGGGTVFQVGGSAPATGWWLNTGVAQTLPSVTATAPTRVDLDGTTSDTYTIPTKANVVYKVGGVTKAAGTYPSGGATSVTVTAEAASGYQLTGTASWTLTWTTTVADNTAPTGTLASVMGSSSAALTATATDNIGVTEYRFSKDGGTTYTAWQAGATYSFTGLTPSTAYSFKVEFRDAALNVGSAVNTASTTAVMAVISDDFNRADGAGLGTAVIGGAWTSTRLSIASNRAAATAWNTGLNTGLIDVGSARKSGTGQATFSVVGVNTNFSSWLLFRANAGADPTTFYWCGTYYGGPYLVFGRMIAGAESYLKIIDPKPVVVDTPYVLTASVIEKVDGTGTDWSFTFNGAVQGSGTDVASDRPQGSFTGFSQFADISRGWMDDYTYMEA